MKESYTFQRLTDLVKKLFLRKMDYTLSKVYHSASNPEVEATQSRAC